MNLRFLTSAETEFQEAIDYYNAQREGLGFEFSDEVRHAIQRIRNYPLAWTALSNRSRRCQVHRFPYSIVYQLRPELVIIVAIQHHRRQPLNWRKRLAGV